MHRSGSAWMACAAALSLVIVPRPAAAATVPMPVAEARQRIAVAEDQRRWDAELSGLLTHPDAAVRARAALAVGRLQDSTTVPALQPLLLDRSADVRGEAAFALGQIGHASARGALEAALRDRDPLVVELAVEALGKLGDRAATAAILPFLDARVSAQRARACESLWRLADSTAANALIAHLGDRDLSVRWRVVYALEKLGPATHIVPAVIPRLADADPLVRAHAARTLGRLKSKLATAALIGALADADAAVVVNAIRGLQAIADSSTSECVPALVRLLTAHREPSVRVTAAVAFSDGFTWASATAAAVTSAQMALHAGLSDHDAATRGACARALVVRFGLPAWREVLPVANDSVIYARVAALDGLKALPDSTLLNSGGRVAGVLSAAMSPGRPRFARMTAIEVAGVLAGRARSAGAPPAFDSLRTRVRAWLADEDVLLAAYCAGALADWGDSASVGRLAEAYAARGKDADADARIAIRDALRTLAGRAFADSLEQAHPTSTPPSSYGMEFSRPPGDSRAILHTSAGDMEWAFFSGVAPQTVRNFVALARRNYFDGLRVHRVVPDFVIQDGDPTGTGSGGPGYTIRCEYNRLRYETGMVGMALSGKDTGGSQWFVTLSPQPHLNGRYTIFARVTRGLEVARAITQGAVVRSVEVLP